MLWVSFALGVAAFWGVYGPVLTAFAGARDGEAPLSSLGFICNTVTTAGQIQFRSRLWF